MVREIVEEPQWAIITGGNSAFGRAAATALGRAGFNIFISCRSTVVCANTINQLKPKVGHGVHVEGLELDLTDFGSIRRFADGVKRKRLLVKVLIHCAGVFCPADGSATKEGVDLAFAVNYIGPFLLTQLLIPELYRARPARIISITNSCYASAHQVDLMHVRNMATKLDLRGQLRVTVHFGKNLEFRSKEPNSFVRVKLMDDKFTTETMKKTANPTYNHLMVFKTENMNEVVHFEVVHLDKNGEEHIIGQAKVHLWELQSDMDALVYNFEKTINLAGDEAKDVHLQATGKEDTLRAKLLSHDKYTLTEDFNLLDESKRQTRSATGKASKGVPSAHTVDLKAKDFKERISQFNDVELNEKANTISFIVRKRLNMFKTSHRRIVLDLHNKFLRNTTVHGRTRKAFPFQQVLGVLQPDKDDDSKLALTFSKTETVDADGNLLASGGQRDYELQFANNKQASLFIEVLSPFLISTARFEDGLITFMVQKKLNHFTAGLRRLVVDLHQRRLLNMDQKTTHVVESAAEDHESVLRSFDFAQIHRFLEESSNPNKVMMQFKGGQREYDVEFLLQEQKLQFLRIMRLFVASNKEPALHVSMSFIKPPKSSNYKFAHHIPMAATLATPNAFDDKKPWMRDTPISLPLQPRWTESDWDHSKVMVDRQKPAGASIPPMSSFMSTAQARLCFVTFTIDLARRLKRMQKDITAHVLDPGKMDTMMYSKAIGLGRRRRYESWKARMWGAPPSEVAASLVEMATSKTFQEHNGLFAQHRGGRLSILNLTHDGRAKPDPAHPIPKCRDESQARQLYDVSVIMAMVDFENPVYSAFLQQ